MKANLMRSAASSTFAHLLGRPVPGAPGATNDKQREDESDEEFQKRRDRDSASAEGDDSGGDDDDLKQREDESDEEFEDRKKKRAEDKKKPEETDEDHEARKKANADRRARLQAAQELGREDEVGDDASDIADLRQRSAGSARLRERARCAAIFEDAAAGKNPMLAATLAFNTDLPRSQALRVLRAGGAAVTTPRNSLDRRMAELRVPTVSAGDTPPSGTRQLSEAQRTALEINVAAMRVSGASEEKVRAFLAANQA